MKEAVSKSHTNFRTRIECLGIVLLIMWLVSCGNDDLPSTIDCLLNPIELQILATEDSKCNLSIGSLEVVVVGDDGPYLYGLDQQEFQNHGLFNELSAGIYNVTVESESGCIDELQVPIKNLDGLDVISISLKKIEAHYR